METWLLALAPAAALFVVTVLWAMGKPVLRYVTVIAWGAAVFTSEAAVAGSGATSGSLTVPKLLPLVVLGAAVVWWLLLQGKRIDGPVLTVPLKWLLAYVSWLTVCALVSDNPVSGVLRMVQIGLPVVAIIAARRAAQPMAAYIAAAIVGCAAHVYYAVFLDPHYVGLEGFERLTGLLIANSFGLAAGITVGGCFGYWLGNRGRRSVAVLLWVTIGACGYALVQAQARTAAIAIVMALIAATATAIQSRQRRTRGRDWVAILGILVVGLYVAFQPSLLYNTTSLFIRGNNDLTTLTGRTPLWANLLTAVTEHPFVGFGPNGYRDHAESLVRYLTVPEANLAVAHNSLVEALVAGGVLAGMLWLAMMISLGIHAWRTPAHLRPVAAALFTVTAVSAITGSSQAGIGIGWYVVLALAALPVAAAPTRAPREEQAEASAAA